MSDDKKPGLQSIVAYSGSESSEEDEEEDHSKAQSTLGGLVESLRMSAAESEKVGADKLDEDEGAKSEEVTLDKIEAESAKIEAAESAGEYVEPAKQDDSELRPPASATSESLLTKVVRLSSGKVVRIKVSPSKAKNEASENDNLPSKVPEKHVTLGDSLSTPHKDLSEHVDTLTKVTSDEQTMSGAAKDVQTAEVVQTTKQSGFVVDSVKNITGESIINTGKPLDSHEKVPDAEISSGDVIPKLNDQKTSSSHTAGVETGSEKVVPASANKVKDEMKIKAVEKIQTLNVLKAKEEAPQHKAVHESPVKEFDAKAKSDPPALPKSPATASATTQIMDSEKKGSPENVEHHAATESEVVPPLRKEHGVELTTKTDVMSDVKEKSPKSIIPPKEQTTTVSLESGTERVTSESDEISFTAGKSSTQLKQYEKKKIAFGRCVVNQPAAPVKAEHSSSVEKPKFLVPEKKLTPSASSKDVKQGIGESKDAERSAAKPSGIVTILKQEQKEIIDVVPGSKKEKSDPPSVEAPESLVQGSEVDATLKDNSSKVTMEDQEYDKIEKQTEESVPSSLPAEEKKVKQTTQSVIASETTPKTEISPENLDNITTIAPGSLEQGSTGKGSDETASLISPPVDEETLTKPIVSSEATSETKILITRQYRPSHKKLAAQKDDTKSVDVAKRLEASDSKIIEAGNDVTTSRDSVTSSIESSAAGVKKSTDHDESKPSTEVLKAVKVKPSIPTIENEPKNVIAAESILKTEVNKSADFTHAPTILKSAEENKNEPSSSTITKERRKESIVSVTSSSEKLQKDAMESPSSKSEIKESVRPEVPSSTAGGEVPTPSTSTGAMRVTKSLGSAGSNIEKKQEKIEALSATVPSASAEIKKSITSAKLSEVPSLKPTAEAKYAPPRSTSSEIMKKPKDSEATSIEKKIEKKIEPSAAVPLTVSTGSRKTPESSLSPEMSDKPSKPSPTGQKAVNKPHKVLPPIPNLEKISLDGRRPAVPVKHKRSSDGASKDDPKRSRPDESSPQKIDFNTSDEIREMLSRRLGSGLDISILPTKSKEPEVKHKRQVETAPAVKARSKDTSALDPKLKRHIDPHAVSVTTKDGSPLELKFKRQGEPSTSKVKDDVKSKRVPESLPGAGVKPVGTTESPIMAYFKEAPMATKRQPESTISPGRSKEVSPLQGRSKDVSPLQGRSKDVSPLQGRSKELSPTDAKVKRQLEPLPKMKHTVPVKDVAAPSVQNQITPLTPYQQRLAMAQQAYQASFAQMGPTPPAVRKVAPLKIATPKVEPPKQTVPGIVIRKMDADGQRKVVPASSMMGQSSVSKQPSLLKVNAKPALTLRLSPTAEKTAVPHVSPVQEQQSLDTTSSSGSDFQKVGESSSSSQDNSSSFFTEGIDFENMIGSSVLSKDPPKVEEVAEPPPAPVSVPESPPVATPRKRGRPRKIHQAALQDPNPIVATWPHEDTATVLTPRGRRARREAPEFVAPPKRKRTKGKDKKEESAEEGGKKDKKEEAKKVDAESQIKDIDGAVKALDVDENTKDSKMDDFEDSKLEDDEDGVKEEDSISTAGESVASTPKPKQKRRRRGPFYVRKRPKPEPKPKKTEKENFQNFEEETRMSASEGTTSPMKSAIAGEESLSGSVTDGTSRTPAAKKGRMEIFVEGIKPITVHQIIEYPWPPAAILPPGEKPENFMIQELISEFLGVKSFKRKYPNLKRRAVDMEERNYLQENGYVSENMCDMGLTAVYSTDIMEIMYNDFPSKFDEYRKVSRERKVREQKALREKQAAERADNMDPRQEALEAAASWNTDLNRERREKRSAYFDLQSFTLNLPRKNKPPIDTGRIGYYPVALVAGQNTDHYRTYTSAELKFFPLSTVLYGPMRPNERREFETEGSDGSGSDSDDSSSSGDSSSSSSGDSQDSSSSDEETNNQEKQQQPTQQEQREQQQLQQQQQLQNDTQTPRSTRPAARPNARSKVKLAVKLERLENISPVKADMSNGRTFKIDDMTITPKKEEIVRPTGPRKCGKCGGDEDSNRNCVFEKLVSCSSCYKFWHPSCLNMVPSVACRVESYKWQCEKCKICMRCRRPPSEQSKIIVCWSCDRGGHVSCGTIKLSSKGKFLCEDCFSSSVDVEMRAEKLESLLLSPETKKKDTPKLEPPKLPSPFVIEPAATRPGIAEDASKPVETV